MAVLIEAQIFQTHSAAVNNYATNMGMRGFITLPLYHAHGIGSFFRAIHSGKQIHLYNAALPLAKQHIMDIMRVNQFEIFYGVPYALKLLAESEEGIALLAACKIVMFGGSACPDSLGDKLVENGVNLVSHYGTYEPSSFNIILHLAYFHANKFWIRTETGQLMTSFRSKGDNAWDYVRPSAALKPSLRFEERGEGLFELVCLEGWPSKVATNRDDGSYATKDLFKKHPTLETYKYFARLDDTIILVNGEKANPLRLEGLVRQHELVAEAVVFGAGKPHLGLVLVPSPAGAEIPREELLDAIWPSVDHAQARMPSYAQISRDMVVALDPDTVYPCTDKGTVIRQAFYRTLEKQIAKAYMEKEGDGDLSLSEVELRDFIRRELLNIVPLENPSQVADDTDLFGLGMDSLQSSQLRSILVKRINTNGNKLGLNIVFDYPTIQSLANKLYSLRVGATENASTTEDEMRNLIAKYEHFNRHIHKTEGPDGQYPIVTRATGSLGAHVVAILAAQEQVTRVYCLVRAPSWQQAHCRVVRSLRDRKVYDILTPSSRDKIVAMPSDFSKPDLGLEAQVFDKLTTEVTAVIHAAWSMNINLRLSSFEKDCIAGAKHLIDLCLAAKRLKPAIFSFCSSVSTVVNTHGNVIPEALPLHLSYAQNMGYAQSKLLTEHLSQIATEQTGISTHVLRIGQVIGDTEHGIWNATEAIPMMLRSSTTIGALPCLDECPRWLPVDTVAKTVIDITLSSAPSGVVNIVNPQTFHWTRDLLPYLLASGIQFDELTPRDWIARLRASNPDPVANPPYKLLQFFSNKYGKDSTPQSPPEWQTEKARTWSKSLSEAPVLDQGLVDRMIMHFTNNCWNLPESRR
jgi:thioester reductase-like protein